MEWLTSRSRLEQAEEQNGWYLLDNELFQDKDGSIYITPRNYKTDNYTIPDWVAWLGGNKSKWDVRPSHLHDFGCQYKQLIRVKLTDEELRRMRYLRVFNDKLICEDIPRKFLELIPVTKWQIDCIFKRAMKATDNIPARVYNLYRCGVFFNVGWLGNHPAYDLNQIYSKPSL